jgi:triosephosphate isomerase
VFLKGIASLVKKNKLESVFKNNQAIIMAPYTFIDVLVQKLDKNIDIGAQDVSKFNQGAFTGEISAKMLKSLGVKYVLTGHSERRINFKESNEDINSKIVNCLHYNLKPILCVGENVRSKIETSNSFRVKKIVFTQLNECLKGLKEDDIKDVSIAYEPV